MSEAAAAEQAKGPPPLDPKLTPAQTLQKNPEPLARNPNVPRSIPPLLMSRFAIAEFRNMRKWICVPENVPIERVIETDFWSQIANSLAVCDVIEVHTDDRAYYAEVYVRDKGRNWAKVEVLRHIKFDSAVDDTPIDPGYEVKFKGPVNKWCVIRKSDGEIIKDKAETKEAASAALAQFVRGLK